MLLLPQVIVDDKSIELNRQKIYRKKVSDWLTGRE
jgi:hypothetical protein